MLVGGSLAGSDFPDLFGGEPSQKLGRSATLRWGIPVDFVKATVILAAEDARTNHQLPEMRGFLQVVSLFGLPLAVLIWYDLYHNSGAYMQTYGSKASRMVAIGIYLTTAFLCLHLPLRLWRRFDAMSLRLFCVTVSLAIFWVIARLATHGWLGDTPLLKTAVVFLIPVLSYPLLSHFLFKWSRAEFTDDKAEGEQPQTEPSDEQHGNS